MAADEQGATRASGARRPDMERGGEPLRLEVPPEPGSVSVARVFVASIARHLGCGDASIEDIKLAISEAVTNAIKAHRDAGVAAPVSVEVRPDAGDEPAGFTVEVRDQGPGFPSQEPPGDYTPPEGLFEGSLGLSLIRSLFPDAEIGAANGRGARVRFHVTI